jgi:hypothetical protein
MLDTCDSIGEIVSLSKKACFFLPPHKENILLRMNKILRNCPYVILDTSLFSHGMAQVDYKRNIH